MYQYKATIIKILDGDTCDCLIFLGFKITTTQRLRLAGIDCYEMNSKDPTENELAKNAKDYLTEKILGKEVTIFTEKSDSFGRYLATIFLTDEFETEWNINETLIDMGLARRYVK